MNLGEAARASAREIAANKFRSALSFAAISVGVASLLYTLAQTRGMQDALAKNLKLMGPGRLTISDKQNYKSKGLSPGLTLADAEALKAELPDLYMVAPRSANWGADMVSGKTAIKRVYVVGVTPDYRKRDWVFKLRGRFLNEYDVKNRSKVVVMALPAGWIKKPFWASFWMREKPYDKWALHHDVLGKQVMLEDNVFTVVGVLTPPPRDRDPRWNSWDTPNAFVPITAYQDRLVRWRQRPDFVDEIRVDTGDEKTLSARRRDITRIMKRRHRGEEDFEIKDEREEIESEMENMRKYVKAGWALGIVALLAGGIGIMNVTLAAIFARVKEIGIRRAVGASKLDIMAQFLCEAAMLGAAGGVMGVVLGYYGIEWLSKQGGQRDIAHLTITHAVGAVISGTAVAALFALLPSLSAARLDPVEALRAE